MGCFNRGQVVLYMVLHSGCFNLLSSLLQCTPKFVSRSGGRPPVRKGAEEHGAIHISNKVKAFSKLHSVHSKWWICDMSPSLLLGGGGALASHVGGFGFSSGGALYSVSVSGSWSTSSHAPSSLSSCASSKSGGVVLLE